MTRDFILSRRTVLDSPRVTRAALLAVLAGTVLLTGCGKHDQTAQAVRKGARDVNVIGGGGGPSTTAAFEQGQYTKVVAEITPVADKGSPEENAAALVMIAQAQMGLAEQPAGEAGVLERECMDRMTVVRSLLGDWLTRNAQALALDQFDPSTALTDLSTRAAEKDKLIAEQKAVKAKLDAQVAELKSQSQQRQAGAQSEETSYAQMKEQSTKVSAVQAEPLVKEAAEHKRKSDELRNAGALLDAKAEQVSRQAAETQLMIDQYTNQRANFEATGKDLRDRLAASKAEASAARADAAKTAARIETLMGEIRTLRAGPLNEAFEKAQRGFQTAAKGAGQAAQGDANGASKLTVGAAQQALGDLNWARARGLGALAQLLDSLAKAEPAMPKRAEYAKEATDLAAAHKDALENVKNAYEAAQSAYAAVRSKSSDSKERLEQLSKALEALRKVATGEAKDLAAALKAGAAPDAPAATDAPPAKPEGTEVAAAPAGGPPELTATVESFLTAVKSGKQSDALALVYFPPEAAATKASLAQLTAAADKLDAACRAKLNVTFAEVGKSMMAGAGGAAGGGAMGMSGLGGDLTPEQLASINPSDVQYAVNGEKATITLPGGHKPIDFLKSDGKWFIDAGPAFLAQAGGATAVAGPLSKAMEELAVDVEAGKFTSAQAVGVGLMQKLAAAMQGLAKPPPGGG